MWTLPEIKAFENSLSEAELKIRTVGSWCHKQGNKGPEHFYIARNPKSSMAVSLCKQITTPLTSIAPADPEIKCMVCHLFLEADKEVQQKQADRVSEALPDDSS